MKLEEKYDVEGISHVIEGEGKRMVLSKNNVHLRNFQIIKMKGTLFKDFKFIDNNFCYDNFMLRSKSSFYRLWITVNIINRNHGIKKKESLHFLVKKNHPGTLILAQSC